MSRAFESSESTMPRLYRAWEHGISESDWFPALRLTGYSDWVNGRTRCSEHEQDSTHNDLIYVHRFGVLSQLCCIMHHSAFPPPTRPQSSKRKSVPFAKFGERSGRSPACPPTMSAINISIFHYWAFCVHQSRHFRKARQIVLPCFAETNLSYLSSLVCKSRSSFSLRSFRRLFTFH